MATKTAKKPEKSDTGKGKAAPVTPSKEAAKTASTKSPSKTAEISKPVPVIPPSKKEPMKNSPAPKQPESDEPQSAKSKPAAKTTSVQEEQVLAPALVSISADKWKEIRQILNRMKEETLQEISRSIRNGSEASVGAEPTGDIYDQASSERDRELGLILNDREREKVHNIDDALLRMDEGEYGICEECDEEIPLGRLKVLPFTRHCVRCKSDLEKVQAQTKRFEEDRAYREIPMGGEDDDA